MQTVSLTVTQIAIIASTILVPLFALLANLAIRKYRRLPASGGADILLLLITFDVTVLMAPNEFEEFVRDASFRQAVAAIFGSLVFINLYAWITSVGYEDRLVQSFNWKTRIYAQFPLWRFVYVWTITVAMIAIHIMVFILKI